MNLKCNNNNNNDGRFQTKFGKGTPWLLDKSDAKNGNFFFTLHIKEVACIKWWVTSVYNVPCSGRWKTWMWKLYNFNIKIFQPFSKDPLIYCDNAIEWDNLDIKYFQTGN